MLVSLTVQFKISRKKNDVKLMFLCSYTFKFDIRSIHPDITTNSTKSVLLNVNLLSCDRKTEVDKYIGRALTLIESFDLIFIPNFARLKTILSYKKILNGFPFCLSVVYLN